MAAPPDNADPALGPWFKSLYKPNGTSCCSIADCRLVESKMTYDGYEVVVDGRWISVPNEIIIHRDNPTGEAVLCQRGGEMHCFVPASET